MGPLRHGAHPATTRGVAHENGGYRELRTVTSKRGFQDALLLRGSRDFTDLDAWRCFIDEIVGRHQRPQPQAHCARAASILLDLPGRRTADYRGEERGRHLERRLHPAPGVLHHALTAHRTSHKEFGSFVIGSTAFLAQPLSRACGGDDLCPSIKAVISSIIGM